MDKQNVCENNMKFVRGIKMAKKMFGILVLAIFILSIVPMALAEQGDGNGKGVMEATKVKLDATKAKLDVTRERYMAAKEKYESAKYKYQEHKENLLQVREKVKSCKEDGECEEVKKNLKVGVKNHLEKTGDVILRSLDRLKSQVEESKVISEEEKEEALANLAEKEEELTALIDEIKEMSEDATAEELREAIRKLKDLWNDIKREQKWIVTQLINNRLSNVVDKHEEYYNAMEMRYSALEEKGASAEDLAELKAIIEKFREEVAELNDEQEEATEAWKKAKSSTEALEKAKSEQQDVREQMRVTKGVLREFTAKFREIYQGLNTEEDSGEVEEEEVEDDSSEVESEDTEDEQSENEEESEDESEEETTSQE